MGERRSEADRRACDARLHSLGAAAILYPPLQPRPADQLVAEVDEELAQVLQRGSLDRERISELARQLVREPTVLSAVEARYDALREALGERAALGQALLLAEHQRLLTSEVAQLTIRRLEAREALERAIVELANRFDELSTIDEEQALVVICEAVQRATRAPLVYFAEVEGSRERGLGRAITIRVAAGPATPYTRGLSLTTDPEAAAGQGPVGRALRSGEVTVAGIPSEPRFALWRQLAQAWNLGSAIVVPVRLSLHRSGALALYRARGAQLPDDVEDVARALGHELERWFYARAQRRRERRRRALDELRRLVLETTDASPVRYFTAIVRRLVGEGAVERAAFYDAIVGDDGLYRLRLVHVEAEEELRRELETLEVVADPAKASASPIIAAAVHLERVVTVGVVASWDGRRIDRTAGRLAHGHMIARYPIQLRGQLAGVVIVDVTDDHVEPLSESFFDQLGDVLASASSRLERNQEAATTEAVAEVSRALLRVSGAIVAASVPEEITEAILAALAKAPSLAGIWLWRRESASERFVLRRGRHLRGIESSLRRLELPSWDLDQVLLIDAQGRARMAQEDAAIWSDPAWGTLLARAGWNQVLVAAVPALEDDGVRELLAIAVRDGGLDPLRLAPVLATGAQLLGMARIEVMLRDRLERERSHQEWLARTDSLTGLLNRSAFDAALQEAITAGPVALGMLDLDNFKLINDSLGHVVGDEFLVQLARALARLVRPDVLVARMGGDEFAILLTGSARHEVEALSGRISGIVRTIGRSWQVTGSLGWASAPEDARSASELLVACDEALYAAKAAGKGRWLRYGGVVAERVEARRVVRSGLEAALEAGEASFDAQPKVDARRGVVVGVELLVRWPKLATPRLVAEVASVPQLARALGRAALREGYSLSRRLGSLPVAVNITPSHFLAASFLEDLEELRVDGARVIVEITEDVALGDIELAAMSAAAVRARGVGVSLDDFGTAASSLAVLARLAVDEVKVDRSFVHRARSDPQSLGVLASLASLETTTPITVVAEGVESDEDRNLWLRLGGSLVQGFRYMAPVPLAELDTLLEPGCFEPVAVPRWPLEDLVLLAVRSQCEPTAPQPPPGVLDTLRSWLHGPGRRYASTDAYRLLVESLEGDSLRRHGVVFALEGMARTIDGLQQARPSA